MTTEPNLRWFTSSYSNNGGNCVEVCGDFVDSRGIVPIRDSKLSDSPVLHVSHAAFAGLVAYARQSG
ncbi:DUF397 domain-containing protein [Streptomyces sp. NPDC059070]|uniref:DUF397 domain-containing protein n=1 Tax=unclassified Streptomyces TaxID=2593676 RepID=UPI0034E2E0C9